MTITVGQTIEGEIETIAFGGKGILRFHNFVIFVPFTAVGDLILCQITEVKRSFAKGDLVKILKAGNQRISPTCPYFGICGGCQLQHLQIEAQLTYKLNAVQDSLKRIGHLSPSSFPIVPASHVWAYRRHVTLHLKPKENGFEAGYIGQDNHSLIVIQECPIFIRSDESILQQVQLLIRNLPNPDQQEGRLTILKTPLNQYILSFQFNRNFNLETAVQDDKVMQSFDLESLTTDDDPSLMVKPLPVVSDSNSKDCVKLPSSIAISRFNHSLHLFETALKEISNLAGIIVQKPDKEYLFGNPYCEEKIDELTFRYSPKTFVQNHPGQSLNIYRRICQLANQKEQHQVLDLYCGFGITSLLLAKSGHSVTGIECNPEAIRFAQENAALNGLKNTHFIQGDVEKILPRWLKKNQTDLIIINPPRQGLTSKVVQQLLESSSESIIYVSCMPATLARDLNLLGEKYQIKEGEVYDMFPQTAHVETLVHLQRKETLS